MKLNWASGHGPATTQRLADLVEKEGQLNTRRFVGHDGRRCLWGVIEDWVFGDNEGPFRSIHPNRTLADDCFNSLTTAGCGSMDNDGFKGTPKERCAEMVRRLREIP